jgi:predicted Rossmann fold flavoprotein
MNESTYEVLVIGGGPAGLMAATTAAERGLRVLLVEKNRRPGVKILMSGGTRCNLTHALDPAGMVRAFGTQGRFLHSALACLSPQDLVDRFHALGVPTKIEPGGKIFPQSDRALDVLDALVAGLRTAGCPLAPEEPLTEIRRVADGFEVVTSKRVLTASQLVLATGGQSYPRCGTAGDGYALAASLGHTIVPPRPALVPITTQVSWVPKLKGITIPDARVEVVPTDRTASEAGENGPITVTGRALAERRASLLFTHFGLSGPAALDVSRAVSAQPAPRRLAVRCDFLPDMKPAALEEWLRQQSASAGARQLATILATRLPARLAETLLEYCGVRPDHRAAELSKAQRQCVLQAIKALLIPVTGTLGFEKAEVTAGGVPLDEIDSHTMESKRVPGLYIVGELLDLDGPIGGYNFQAAFSTGRLAGLCLQ